MNKQKFIRITVAIFFTTLTQCSQHALADNNDKLQNHKQSPFVFLQEGNVYGKTNGMAMICPAHKHGTPQDALKKLKEILQTWPKGKSISIWVCRANQVATLKMFAPMGDRIFINPFVHSRKNDSKKPSVIWPGFDHSCINHIRKIIDASDMKPLIACLNVNGEPNHFKKRNASFEEIEWMTYAAIGAGFKGIVWRGNTSALPWANKLRHLECVLSQYANEFGGAKIASNISSHTNQPCSVLVSENVLLIILLNPKYCKGWDEDTLILPVDEKPCHGTLKIATPPGKSIKACKTISNMPIQLRSEGGNVLLDFEFTGGGICYILQLQKNEWVDGDIPSNIDLKKVVMENPPKKAPQK